jgi:UPF0271 protein
MKNLRIDINADIGEGLDNDALLMPFLSSCNIACGGHAGTSKSMRTVIRLAKQYQVKIGAHPSLPDKKNFGRKPMEISCAELFISLSQQIRNFRKIVDEENCRLNHIKPHGALYNLASKDVKTAEVIIEVIKTMLPNTQLYAPYNSVISKIALSENIPVIFEAFIDRSYNPDGTLVSREKDYAIIMDENQAFEQLLGIIQHSKVKTHNDEKINMIAKTFCIHGDHPKVIQILNFIKKELPKHRLQVS